MWSSNEHLENSSSTGPKSKRLIFKSKKRQQIENDHGNCCHKETNTNNSEVDAAHPKKRLKADCAMHLKGSSVYALVQIVESKTKVRKAFWSLILVCGLVGCLSQVTHFLNAYYNYPIVVNIDTRRNETIEFPAVTVCNLNVVKKDYVHCLKEESRDDNCSDDYFKFLKENNNYTMTCPEIDDMMKRFSEKEWYESKVTSLDFVSRFVYGHQLGDFIISCKFDQQSCQRVCAKDETEGKKDCFILSFSHKYGNCFTFHLVGNPRRSNNDVGVDSGLELEINLEPDRYAPYTENVGARVHIHDPNLPSNIDDEGVNISPGYHTFIRMRKHVSMRLPAPYKDRCRDYGPFADRNTCNIKCLNLITLSMCSCVRDVHDTLLLSSSCDFSSVRDLCCWKEAMKKFLKECNCPLECSEVNYQYQLSFAEWPSNHNYIKSANGTENGLSLEETRKSRLKVSIFFDRLDYVVYQQNPLYQSSEVLSQIGGQMGLWLGMSVLVVVECIEVFVSFCRYCKSLPVRKLPVNPYLAENAEP